MYVYEVIFIYTTTHTHTHARVILTVYGNNSKNLSRITPYDNLKNKQKIHNKYAIFFIYALIFCWFPATYLILCPTEQIIFTKASIDHTALLAKTCKTLLLFYENQDGHRTPYISSKRKKKRNKQITLSL